MQPRHIVLPLCLFLFSVSAFAQGNGKLQLHFIDVGQGDGALLISPGGETVLFDNGVRGDCEKPIDYLQGLGISQIDYMIISHYHADHFGCTTEVLDQFPLRRFSYDRPGAYNSGTYTAYVEAVGDKRRSVRAGRLITLDANSDHPVTINIAGYNGAGVDTDNENDRSVVAVIHFGNFDAVMGGDLSGFNTPRYKDIETTVSRRLGQLEVYKTHHHGSDHSSNNTFLRKIRPRIAIISAGNGNSYGHPTRNTVRRLHNSGLANIYWTQRGNGATPVSGVDVVANGSILIQVETGASNFTVTYGSQTDIHPMWPGRYRGRR